MLGAHALLHVDDTCVGKLPSNPGWLDLGAGYWPTIVLAAVVVRKGLPVRLRSGAASVRFNSAASARVSSAWPNPYGRTHPATRLAHNYGFRNSLVALE